MTISIVTIRTAKTACECISDGRRGTTLGVRLRTLFETLLVVGGAEGYAANGRCDPMLTHFSHALRPVLAMPLAGLLPRRGSHDRISSDSKASCSRYGRSLRRRRDIRGGRSVAPSELGTRGSI